MDTINNSITNFLALTENVQFTDPAWRAALASEMAIWKATYKQTQAIKPSGRYTDYHAKVLASLAKLDSAADDWTYGIDNMDAGRIDQGSEKILEGLTLLRESTGMLKNIR